MTAEQVRRQNLVLAPSWSRALDERLVGRLEHEYSDTDYGETDSGLVDFAVNTTTVTGEYLWAEETRLLANTALSFLDVPEIDTNTTDVSALVGIDHQFTERLTVTALAGARFTESEFVIAGEEREQRDIGPLFDFTVRQTFERTNLTASLSRITLPTGSGDLVESTRLRLEVRHRLTPRWRLDAVALYLSNTSDRDDQSSSDRTLALVRPRVTWRATDDLDVSVSYRFRRQDRESDESAAVSNAVFLTLTYALPRLVF